MRRVRGVLTLAPRRHRRIAVVLALAITALLGSQVPRSLHGWGIVVALVLAALDIALIRSTGGLAFTRRRTLDERETALRDHAYRRGFRLLGLALAVEAVIFIATSWISFALADRTQSLVTFSNINNVITGRGLTAIVELLVMLPTLMIAWAHADHVDGDSRTTSRAGALLWLAVPAFAGFWLVAVSAGPEQGAAANANSVSFGGLQGATCAPFAAGRVVGSEFGATVGLRVGVCWNGTAAFVVGDPSVPLPPSAIAAENLPAGAPSDAANFADPSVTACGLDNIDDFVTVTAMSCTGSIDGAGTLHYTVRADVSALPGGIGERTVTMNLVVARDGHVLVRP